MDLLIDTLQQLFSPLTAAFAIAAIGLNVHFGLTGLLNMGHAGFMLIGAYGYAIATIQGAPIWLAVIISLAGAGLFALLLGWPTLKLRGDYLAIVTIAAAEMVRLVGRTQALEPWTGASTGITGKEYKEPFEATSPFPERLIPVGPFELHGTASSSWWLTLVSWSVVALLIVLYWLLQRSPWGRVLRGIREDEDAVRSLGKNVYSFKMQALVLGGMIGALGGVSYALGAQVHPDSMGRPTTFLIWTLLLLGGAASVFGPALGSMLFLATQFLVKGVLDVFVPDDIVSAPQAETISLAFVGITLMLLIIFRPQGILGKRRELAING